MNNKKPQDSYFPKDYELKNKLKDLQQNQIPRPKLKEEKSDEKGLNLLKSLNRKVSIFLDSKSIDLTDEEKKKEKSWNNSLYINSSNFNHICLLFLNL